MAYDLSATEAYIRQAAQRRGIDPDTAVRVARSEGLARGTWQSNVRHPSRGREPSYGPFQLLVGGQNGWPTGMGNDFVRKTGLDPSDPANVNATIDFALDGAAQNGWGAWYGAAKVGVGNRDGIGGARPVNSYAEGAAPKGGASSAIQSVLADRSPSVSPTSPSPSPASSGGSMAAPTINIGPRRSNKLAEAMIDRAHANSGNIISPMQLWGSLAQVFAGNQQIRENEKHEASALQQAMAGANLDPAYMMAAQLGGDRESLASSILAQQGDRAKAAQRTEDRQWELEDSARDHQNALAVAQAKAGGEGGAPEYGLTPQYGVDAQGNPVVIQLGKDGSSIRTPLPDGVSLSREPIRLDAGTHFVILDPITRQPVGTIPKENREAAAETAAGTVEGRTAAERATSASSDLQAGMNALDLIETIRTDPYKARGTGGTSVLNRVPGTGGYDFQNKVDAAKAGAFLQAVQQMRGLGALSNTEGQAATAAITRMDTATSEEAFDAALADYEKIVRQGITRAQGNMPAPQPQRGPMDLGAPGSVHLDEVTVPAIDDLLQKYGG